MFLAYRPHQTLILGLYSFFNQAPTSPIPSNFPALARKLQDLQNGIEPDMVYSAEAPQERDIDFRVAHRRVENALQKMPSATRAILRDAYRGLEADPRIERGVTQLLLGLMSYSKYAPVEQYIEEPYMLGVIRNELDAIWREAHREFEKVWTEC